MLSIDSFIPCCCLEDRFKKYLIEKKIEKNEAKIAQMFFQMFRSFSTNTIDYVTITNPKNWEIIELKKTVKDKQKIKHFLINNSLLTEGGEQKVFASLIFSKKSLFKPYVCLRPNATGTARRLSPKHLALHQIASDHQISDKIYYDQNWSRHSFMRFSDGGDLLDYLEKEGSLSPEMQLQFSKQLIELVKNLHQLDISHRDIKPQNILVKLQKGAIPRLFLTDFGFATTESFSKKKPGTPIFKPVEYTTQQIFDTKKSDSFCLGLTLFSICTGTDFYMIIQGIIRKERPHDWQKINPDSLFLDFFRRYRGGIIDECMKKSHPILREIVDMLTLETPAARLNLNTALDKIKLAILDLC